ncbi:MAG: radical SAM family heme chaperone HemW [Cellulosilyticaceae bacterium]
MKIGLYVHIPFCHSKCHYCDFLSFANKQLDGEYVEALVKELCNYSKIIQGVHTIKSIFIGGGTPTVLSPFLLERVCTTIREKFNLEEDVEWTIEANPGTIVKGHIEVFNKCGVNRVSLGLQACQDQLLKDIGRIHTFKEWEQSIYNLCESEISNINTDLMFMLPGQTLKDWEYSLRTVCSYPIQHISGYSLIVEEGTRFGDLYSQDKLSLPSEEEDRQMYELVKSYLKEVGYKHYEISNWAKSGKECKHNILYWKQESYIGAGIGAHSYLDEIRYSNTYDLKKYIAYAGDLEKIRQDEEVITKKMSQEEFMFLGLRLLEGISLAEFQTKYGQALDFVYKNQIEKWIKEKALVQDKDRLYLTDFGVNISNQIFSSFL